MRAGGGDGRDSLKRPGDHPQGEPWKAADPDGAGGEGSGGGGDAGRGDRILRADPIVPGRDLYQRDGGGRL